MDATTKFAGKPETFNNNVYYIETIVLLWRVIPPILIFIGTIGNAMTILVLLRQKKMTSTAVFLFALALSDTLILFSTLLPNWVLFTWDVEIRSLSNPGCKASRYLHYCSIHLSSWLTVAVTLERTACVLFPLKVRLCCSPRNAVWIIVTIVLAVFGINIIVLVMTDTRLKICLASTNEYRYLDDYVYPWIDFTLTFGAPFPLLLIGNVIIVVKLARSRSRRQRMNISGQGRDTRPVSMLMIALCVLFLITMTPASLLYVYNVYFWEALFGPEIENHINYFYFLNGVAQLVTAFNATFNFALYVFSGSKFRAELKSMLCCKATTGTNLFGR